MGKSDNNATTTILLQVNLQLRFLNTSIKRLFYA